MKVLLSFLLKAGFHLLYFISDEALGRLKPSSTVCYHRRSFYKPMLCWKNHENGRRGGRRACAAGTFTGDNCSVTKYKVAFRWKTMQGKTISGWEDPSRTKKIEALSYFTAGAQNSCPRVLFSSIYQKMHLKKLSL